MSWSMVSITISMIPVRTLIKHHRDDCFGSSCLRVRPVGQRRVRRKKKPMTCTKMLRAHDYRAMCNFRPCATPSIMSVPVTKEHPPLTNKDCSSELYVGCYWLGDASSKGVLYPYKSRPSNVPDLAMGANNYL